MFERIWDVSPRSLLQGFSQSLPEQVDWSVTPVRAGNVDQPSSFLKRAWKATSRVISYVIIHPLQTITAGLAVQSVAVVAFQPTVEIEKFSETLLEAGSEFQVNVYTANDQYGPAVTALKDGGFVIAWHSMGQDGSGFGVYSRRYTADEVGGPELQLNSYTNSDQDSPSVAALEDGGFVITWHSMGQDGSGHGVYGRRYTANGVGSSEFQVNVYTANDQYGPAVAALKDGGFVIAWHSMGQDGSGFGVYSRRYTADEVGGPELQVNSYTNSDQDSPSVAALEDRGFVITWHSMGQDGSGHGVYGRRYTANGVGSSEFQVNVYTANYQYGPAVAALEDGGFVITWHSMGQDGSGHGVYGRRYMANGVGSSEFQVNVYTANYQYGPAVAALKDGGFVIAWQSRGQDGSGEGIYSRLYKPRSSVTPVISPSITNSPTSDAPSFSNTIAHSPGPVLFSTVAQSSLSAERPDNSNNSDWSRCNNISCQLLVGIISSVVGGISTAAFIKYCKEI